MDLAVMSNLLRIMISVGGKLPGDFIVSEKFQSKKLDGGHHEKVPFSPTPDFSLFCEEGHACVWTDVDGRDWVFRGECVGWEKR